MFQKIREQYSIVVFRKVLSEILEQILKVRIVPCHFWGMLARNFWLASLARPSVSLTPCLCIWAIARALCSIVLAFIQSSFLASPVLTGSTLTQDCKKSWRCPRNREL